MGKDARAAASARAPRSQEMSPEPESHLVRRTLLSTVTLLVAFLLVGGGIAFAQNSGMSAGWTLLVLCLAGAAIGLLVALVLAIRVGRMTRRSADTESDA